MVEDHRDIGAEPDLKLNCPFWREGVPVPVDVGSEEHPLFRHLSLPGKAEDLEPAAIGEYG